MTKYIWIMITVFLFTSCSSDTLSNTTKEPEKAQPFQNETIKVDDGEEVYKIVDEMPRLTGCGDAYNKKACSEKKLLQYLYSNIEYDSIARKNGDVETNIVFSIVIEKDGTVSNFEVVKGTESQWNIRSIVESMPLWLPGKLNGVPKRVKMHIPLKLHFK